MDTVAEAERSQVRRGQAKRGVISGRVLRGRQVRVALLLSAAFLLAGCSSSQRWAFLRHSVVVDHDTLDSDESWTSPPPNRVYSVGVEVGGFEGDNRHFLAAILEAIDAHPGLKLRRWKLRGKEAHVYPTRTDPRPERLRIELKCATVFCGSPLNALVAFPGMIPFLPVYWGYSWELDLAVTGRVLCKNRTLASFRKAVHVEFREKNARRSAVFHLWPSTGFFGVQFIMGFFLAPRMSFYESDETTPVLIEALQPRLGRTFAHFLYRQVKAASPSISTREGD